MKIKPQLLLSLLVFFQVYVVAQTYPIDYTDSITNPSFETGDFTGWVNESSFDIRNIDDSSFPYADGHYFVDKWQVNNWYDLDINTTIDNLPNGLYVLTAAARALSTEDTSNCYLYADDQQTEVTVSNNYHVISQVEDNDLTVGLKVTGESGNWIVLDDFHLYYYGENPEIKNYLIDTIECFLRYGPIMSNKEYFDLDFNSDTLEYDVIIPRSGPLGYDIEFSHLVSNICFVASNGQEEVYDDGVEIYIPDSGKQIDLIVTAFDSTQVIYHFNIMVDGYSNAELLYLGYYSSYYATTQLIDDSVFVFIANDSVILRPVKASESSTIEFVYNDENGAVVSCTDGHIFIGDRCKVTVKMIVTAEDGITQKCYYVNIISSECYSDVTLSGIYVDDVLIEGFNPVVYKYNIAVGCDSVLPTISAVAYSELAQVTIDTAISLSDTTFITVVSEDNSTTIYYVSYSYSCPASAVSIEESNISIYPTISDKGFLLTTDSESVRVIVYSLEGKIVKQFSTSDKRTSFSLDKAQMYIVKVDSESGSDFFKILKK